MIVFYVCLFLASFGCALVAGITLIFAIVVMPGIKSLGDRGFLESFKAIDRVIQDNHPVFMLVWIGSAVALLGAAVFGFGSLSDLDRAMLAAALLLYLFGVQLVTAMVNVPLNNQLQAQNLKQLDDAEIAQVRQAFERRWLRWNVIRTWFTMATTVLLLVLLLRT